MPKGVKLEHTGVTHKDMDFQNLSKATRNRILAGFRVSKTILADASVRAAVDRSVSLMAQSYNETTLNNLKQVLRDKLSQSGGTNLDELTNAVDGVYSFADERRAGLIAKTESFRTANYANLRAWQVSGVVKTVKWYTAEDDKVCPQCQELDGKTVDIGEDFFAAEYGERNQPPVHPDCRCYIRPETISAD
jgi:SPP1 gp7 family putative phage head morphogenesis protein